MSMEFFALMIVMSMEYFGGVQGGGASNKSSNDQQHSVSLCGVRGRDLHAVGLVLHRKAVLLHK